MFVNYGYDCAVLNSVLTYCEFTMTLTFSTFELAITRSSVFIRLAGREAFFNRPEGQPLGMFSKDCEGGNSAFWGLGFYGVVSRVLPAPRAALLEG